jgi:hypothetical protein
VLVAGSGVESKIIAKIYKLNLRFFEVSVSYHGRAYEQEDKINFKDGLR